jgi:hypothetical protein
MWQLSEKKFATGLIKFPCALTEHHAMKVYWGSGGIAELIL